MKKNLLCFVIILWITINLYPQQDMIQKKISKLKQKYPVPELTVQQMTDDYDTLVSIMKKKSLNCLVIKKATGYDPFFITDSLRKTIPEIKNTTSFIKLVDYTLSLLQEEHAIINPYVWYMKDAYPYMSFTEKDFAYTFHYRDSMKTSSSPLYLLYAEGHFYTRYPSLFYNNNPEIDTFELDFFTNIIKIYNIPLSAYYNKLHNRTSRWDVKNKQYYSDRLYIDHNKKFITSKYPSNLESTFPFFAFKQDFSNEQTEEAVAVKYFDKDRILYIRLPQMEVESVEKIKDTLLSYKNSPIKAVMIDVRGNPGGNDQTWHSLLSLIIKEPLDYFDTVVLDCDQRYYEIYEGADFKTVNIPLLDPNRSFLIGKDSTSILPDSNSLNYSGKIYLLIDEFIYSSTGAFSSLSCKTDVIKTVGTPTGTVLGSGPTPLALVLPNSGCIFTIRQGIEYTNTQKVEDLFFDTPSYSIHPSVNYYRYYFNPDRKKVIDEEQMYKNDEIFLKALEVVKNNKK